MAATRIDCDIHPAVGGTRTTLLLILTITGKAQRDQFDGGVLYDLSRLDEEARAVPLGTGIVRMISSR
jgi:hypothetical protein